MRAALNGLAAAAPDWLLRHSSPEWFERYGVLRVDAYRLPRSEAGRAALAEAIGRDGHDLLAALYVADAPLELRTLPAVESRRHVWIQQFYLEDGRVRWRPPTDRPAARRRAGGCTRPTTARPCAAASAARPGSGTRCTPHRDL